MDEKIKAYARLARRKHDLRAKLNQVEKELDALELHAAHGISKAGLDQVQSYGMTLRPTMNAKVKQMKSTREVVAALKKARRTELLGVIWPALISYCKKANASKAGLPKSLAEVFKVTHTRGIDARRSPRTRKG